MSAHTTCFGSVFIVLLPSLLLWQKIFHQQHSQRCLSLYAGRVAFIVLTFVFVVVFFILCCNEVQISCDLQHPFEYLCCGKIKSLGKLLHIRARKMWRLSLALPLTSHGTLKTVLRFAALPRQARSALKLLSVFFTHVVGIVVFYLFIFS